MGLTAADEKDFMQAGYEIIKTYDENIKKTKNKSIYTLEKEVIAEILGTKNSTPDNELYEYYRCDVGSFCCLETTIPNNILDSKRYKALIDRFQKLKQMSSFKPYEYFGTMGPYSQYSLLTHLSQVYLVNTYQTKSNRDFILQLSDDFDFWQNIASSDSYLIDKMVAIDLIKNDMFYLSEFIREKKTEHEDINLIENLVKPLSKEVLSFEKVFKNEMKYSLNIFNEINADDFSLDSLLFQPNATKNYYFKSFLNNVSISNLPLSKFIQKHKEKKPGPMKRNFKIHQLYNYLGKLFVDYTSSPAYSDYIAKAHDSNNMIRLVNLQFQIKQAGGEEFIDEILNKPENLNPYDNKPFIYNKENKTLSFECLFNPAKNFKCEIRI
ncbi:MAG: hypothetical protein KDI59_06415 [Xanthomonadales bacterium]|nr:hypothetical protein [Xanthomonadales bacterium]